MAAEQLSLFEEFDKDKKKLIRKTVIKELRLYKALKVAVQNKIELQQNGKANLFPVIVESDKELKVMQIERSLEQSLDYIQKQIIEEKYLNKSTPTDLTLYTDIGLTKDQYYQKRDEAIFTIATALNII